MGPGRVWLKRPRSTGRPLVGGCTREAELETASLSSPRASFHSVPYDRIRTEISIQNNNSIHIFTLMCRVAALMTESEIFLISMLSGS